MQSGQRLNLKTCSIEMHFDKVQLPQGLHLLLSLQGPISTKDGCRACRVEQDLTERGLIRYTEEWNTGADFEKHLRSREFWSVLVAMDLCCEDPTVLIGDLSADLGLDFIRQIREAGDPEKSTGAGGELEVRG